MGAHEASQLGAHCELGARGRRAERREALHKRGEPGAWSGRSGSEVYEQGNEETPVVSLWIAEQKGPM
jgi:hypothetical protein